MGLRGQAGDCVTAAAGRPQAPAFAGPCVCVCIAGTPERQALGAAPASVNQKERKKKKTLMVYLGKVCFNRSDLQYALTGHFFRHTILVLAPITFCVKGILQALLEQLT